MNRAFISLYFFLVSSIVLIGWGLNHVWNSFAPEDQLHSDEIQSLFYWIEKNIENNPDTFLSLDTHNNNIHVELLHLDEFSGSAAVKSLQKGEILSATNDTQLLWYKRVGASDQVIVLSKDIQRESLLNKILLILFYVALALVIYLWVWPLSRDAKKLEIQTQSPGPDQLPEELHLSNRSTLYPLAKAFNQMLGRLRGLIASYKDMTNAVSHELRTPLARMKFALALIDETKLDNKTRQQLASVAMDIHEMESLINSLLIYAGFEQQTQKLQFTSGRIGDLLENLHRSFLRTYPVKPQLEIRDLSSGVEFLCEWKLMETVLQNLLGNAARFARARICIEACVTESEFRIMVDDDGAGIPVAERQRVFESFVRLYDEQQEPQKGGFGLGLAIVKRILQWHQGGVHIEQAPELGGARLVLYWPMKSFKNV